MGIILWLGQRICALFMMVYVTSIYMFFSSHSFNYESWTLFFSSPWGRPALMFFSLAFGLHAMIGVWVIATDYLRPISLQRIFLTCYLAILLFGWLAIAMS